MDLLFFEIAIMIILLVALVIIGIVTDMDFYLAMILFVVIIIGSFTIPSLLFIENATYSDTDKWSYELVKNDYLQAQSGKYGGLIVSYIDDTGKVQKRDITNCEIIYYDGYPKIEFVNGTWGFLRNTKKIVYLNKEIE